MEFQDLILKISMQFINLDSDELDARIVDTLKKVCKLTEVSGGYVFLLSDDRRYIAGMHRWNTQNKKPIIKEIHSTPVTRFWWWAEQILDKKPIYISDVASLPDECESEKKECIERGVQSILIIPMIFKNDVIGCLGFYTKEKTRKWSPREIAALQTVTDIIVSAVVSKKSEKALKESEQRYRFLIENINDAILINQKGRFVFFNHMFCDMLGYTQEELSQKEYIDVFTAKGLAALHEREALRNRGFNVSPHYETTLIKKNGTIINVQIDVSIVDYLGAPASLAVVMDVTERKKLEKEFQEMKVQYLKRQRLSSLETMVGDMVHDIKNTLSIISGRAQMLSDRLHDLKEPDIIIRHAKQIEKMVSAFLKKVQMEKDLNRKSLDLNELIKTEITFFESNSFFKNEIIKHFQLEKSIPPISGAYVDFSHGIMNIIQFSALSMEDSPQKILTIKTSLVSEGILIEISSTGKEIPAEVASALFSPVEIGRLGFNISEDENRQLPTVNLYHSYLSLQPYGVIFSVESKPGGGNTFRLTVPT